MRSTSRTLLFLLLTASQAMLAQAPGRAAVPPAAPGEVRGTVSDAKDTLAAPRSSITVKSRKDSSVVAGAMTSASGAFRIQGLRPGAYVLRVTAIGYSPSVHNFSITPAEPVATIGVVRLTRFAVALKGVEVTTDRATMAVEPDRNSYRAKDVAPAATNASEILDATPSVQVDADGKVSLRGNENVAVQINGRPSPITGTQLGAYLKSLPASVIDRVEVVPNPSAKYDPEGMAGIINIVLKTTVDLGYSGGANAGIANKDRYNVSGNLGYQAGPITSMLNAGANRDDRAVIGINDRERLDALQAPSAYTEQDIATLAGNSGQNLTANLDYKLTGRDVLTNALTINHRGTTDATTSAYSELTGGRTLLSQYDRLKNTTAKGLMFDYDMSFKRTFEPRKHEWSGEVRFNRSHDEDVTTLWRQTPASAGAVSRAEGEHDDTDALTKQLTAQTDYTQSFGEHTKLESGLKSNIRWLDRDFSVLKDSLGTGTWAPSGASNALTFNESVHAAYAVVSQGVGRFDLQAGLRGEAANRDFRLAGNGTSYPYRYASVFPSGVVNYNVNDGVQMKASYSRRIRRPGTQELNPFPSFFDAQNVFIGNPQLNPEYTDAIELGVTKTGAIGTLQLSPFYRHTSNVIRVLINTADHVDGREVTSVTFSNLAKSNSWGTDLNASVRLGNKLNGFAGFNVYKMVTDGGSLSSVGSNAVTWSSRLNATSQLTPTLSVSGNYFYRAPMKIEGGQFYAMQMVNLSVRKKVNGDKGAVQLRIVDPFSTGLFRVRAGDSNVIQVTERSFGVRGVFLGYQYTFGQTPRVRQVQPEQQQQGPGFP